MTRVNSTLSTVINILFVAGVFVAMTIALSGAIA